MYNDSIQEVTLSEYADGNYEELPYILYTKQTAILVKYPYQLFVQFKGTGLFRGNYTFETSLISRSNNLPDEYVPFFFENLENTVNANYMDYYNRSTTFDTEIEQQN